MEVWDCTKYWNSCGFDSAAGAITAIGGHVATPFDMGVEMVRSLLVKLPSEIGAPNKHLMMICIHHSISDGWSIPIVLRDLLTAYPMHMQMVLRGRPGCHIYLCSMQTTLCGSGSTLK